jgi:L-asparaginase II
MYEPQVNDYVLWKDHIEGWVYFKDQQYITIESWVRPKTQENYNACSIHKNNRLLVLCYHTQWDELTYVKSRESVYEEEKVYVEMVGESIRGEGDEK